VLLVHLEKQPSWFERLAADWSRPSDSQDQGRDMLAMLSAKQTALAWSAVADVRRLASGASIQARCLECGPVLTGRTPDRGLLQWLAALLRR
jgi:protease IV